MRQLAKRGRRAPIHARWSRIGLKSVIFAKILFLQKVSIMFCKCVIYANIALYLQR